MGDAAAGLANPMLGSQLISKSILPPNTTTTTTTANTTSTTTSNNKEEKDTKSIVKFKEDEKNNIRRDKICSINNNKNQLQQVTRSITNEKTSRVNNNVNSLCEKPSKSKKDENSIVINQQQQQQKTTKSIVVSEIPKEENFQLVQGQLVDHVPQETSPCKRQNQQHSLDKIIKQRQLSNHNQNHNLSTNNSESIRQNTSNNQKKPITQNDFESLAKETQELLSKSRKLQLEIDEKNEIINVLKDELETTKEQQDKFERENIQLLKDSKRVKFLQDENDFLQDKMGNVDKLELEIKKLKERLAETDFLKLRVQELEEDKTKAQEESNQFEERWKKAEASLHKIIELECELNKWKSFSQELELEKNSIQAKLLESIEQEAKLNRINKQVEDEVKRLKSLIKTLEEQRDEDQASNSLIMSVSDLKQLDIQTKSNEHNTVLDKQMPDVSSIKFELDKELEKEVNEENRNLKQQLTEQEIKYNNLLSTNKSICDELDGNKKLISELRQDLACEKSLASKLSKQLATFTKQIQNLDKHYFPIHDSEATTNSSKNKQNGCYEDKVEKNVEKESSLLNSVTSIDHKHQQSKNDALVCENSYNNNNNTIIINDEDKKMVENNKLQGNDRVSKNINNATRQQVNSKLSSITTDKRTSNLTTATIQQLDNTETVELNTSSSRHWLNISKQSITELEEKNIDDDEHKNVLSVSIEKTEKRCLALNVTNKSNTLLGNDSDDKILLSTVADKEATMNNNKKLVSSLIKENLQLEGHDRSLNLSKRISPQSIDGDEQKDKRKHGNNNNFVEGANSKVMPSSVSPSFNGNSQTSSPSAAITVGHDSGFQSINHDLNQISPSSTVTTTTTTNSGARNTKTKPSNAGDFISYNKVALGTTTTTNEGCKFQQKSNQSTQIEGNKNVKVPATTTNSKLTATPTQFSKAKQQHLMKLQQQQDKNLLENNNEVPTKLSSIEKNDDGIEREFNPNSSLLLAKDGSQIVSNSDAANKIAAAKILANSSMNNDKGTCSKKMDKKINCTSIKVGDNNHSFASKTNDNFAVIEKEGENSSDEEDEDDIINVKSTEFARRAPTPVKSTRVSSSTSNTNALQNNNFVRNSIPSRSINFGHSKSSAYLDRIRASVTASTTTNTSSSFEEQTQKNLILSQQQHKQPVSDSISRPILNCMLNHQHSERCFIFNNNNNTISSNQNQQIDLIANNNQNTIGLPQIVQSSRQINALIDPVSSNDQRMIMMNTLPHHHHHHHHHLQRQHQQQQNCLPMQPNQHSNLQNNNNNLHHLHHMPNSYVPFDGSELTEQQIAQLASLHHQHYYHHLQHMHQLHQLHHQHHLHQLHRMHHKYDQKQQNTQTQPQTQQQQQNNSDSSGTSSLNRSKQQQVLLIQQQQQLEAASYTGGSQFYAPSAQLDQVYANMTANNKVNEQKQQHQQLVNNDRQSPIKEFKKSNLLNTTTATRLSPQRAQIVSQNHNNLPQIDEINGLPIIDCNNKQYNNAPLIVPRTSTTITTTSKPNTNNVGNNSNGSPSTSSSPTSSTSSNLSAGSSSSSTSGTSLNSFTGIPINRTPLRHTTTELSRNGRQFSVERELIGAMPMTATLSRVGSCRGGLVNSNQQTASGSLNRSLDSTRTNLARNIDINNKSRQAMFTSSPVKSHQVIQNSMILNSNEIHHQRQSFNINNIDFGRQAGSIKDNNNNNSNGKRVDRVDKLTNNLANIKLDDKLAFASLRAPKNSTSAGCSSGINNRNSLNENNYINIKQQTPNPNYSPTSSSNNDDSSTNKLVKIPSKLSSAINSNSNNNNKNSSTKKDNKSNGNAGSSNNNNNNNKSSVWFEYGCV